MPGVKLAAVPDVCGAHADAHHVLPGNRGAALDLEQVRVLPVGAVGVQEEGAAEAGLVLDPAHAVCCADGRLLQGGDREAEPGALGDRRIEALDGVFGGHRGQPVKAADEVLGGVFGLFLGAGLLAHLGVQHHPFGLLAPCVNDQGRIPDHMKGNVHHLDGLDLGKGCIAVFDCHICYLSFGL